MIVNYGEEGWEVITQRAHGILAAQIASHWRVKDRPSRWMETLLAIAEHDDAESELDGENLLAPTGGPLNFSMKNFELPHCQRLSDFTRTKSRYIALLTSMHMEFLYRKDAPKDPQAARFLEKQQQLQNKWRKELGMTKDASMRVYDLLEWCDAFSLLLCQKQVQPEGRTMEISTGPDKKMYHLFQSADDVLHVTPWPFQDERFTVCIESRIIRQIQFASSAEFRKAFIEADAKETTWQLAKPKAEKRPSRQKI